jgi:hypothetical protein
MNILSILTGGLGVVLLVSACTIISSSGGEQETLPGELPVETVPSKPEATQALVEPAAVDDPPPARALFEFATDFSRHSVPYREIISGGPPKDGIPPVDNPKFVGVEEASEWLDPVEPVILVEVGEDARAFPLQILTYHEIVNDTIGGLALAVTFCPLCNTAIVFERTVDGVIYDFGTTGNLRYSNLIMYDRQTESWWQQANGEAIVGELLGSSLNFYPASIIAWDNFVSSFPSGKVLSRETGFSRPYGRNPYIGYDDVNNPPFLYRGPITPDTLPPAARVLTVDLGAEAVAYPYEVLEAVRVVNDTLAGKELVVFWKPGVSSALDSAIIAEGRDVGTASAFSRQVEGRVLTFRHDKDRLVDKETGSEWSHLGLALNGELAGKQLEPVVSINHFWFSWAAFKPETRIYSRETP